MRAMSVNTWIIVINVIVFIIGHILLAGLPPQKTSAGEFTVKGVSADELKGHTPDKSITLPFPNVPNFFFHPIYDPKTPQKDDNGRIVVRMDGTIEPRLLGGERFTYMPIVQSLGHFSTGKSFLHLQVWRFLTFQFLHADITHIVFNMMGLWFVGGLVEEYLGRRRYLAFYLACGLFGGVSYLILNFIGYFIVPALSTGLREQAWLPALLFDDPYMPLIGASAGVFGVLMAAAYIAPSALVDVMFVIPMKLRTAVYLFLGFAALNLLRGGNNAGGDAAHVGGAIAGAFLIRRPHLLRDFFDLFGDSRKSARSGGSRAIEVDSILAKVRDKGLESLTPAERETLRRASEAARERYAE
jgi:membrane associated rhomboid family serine protease